MVYEALKFMFIGMGIVYIFLLLLVFAITIQAKLIAKYFPEKEQTEPIVSNSNSNQIDRKKVAAIAAALNMHIDTK